MTTQSQKKETEPKKDRTTLGRLYDTDSYNVRSRRDRPMYDIENEERRANGLKPKTIPEASRCNRCEHRAWTVLPYFDEWGNDVNLSVDEAIRDLTMRLDRRRLQVCESCFNELERRRKASNES